MAWPLDRHPLDGAACRPHLLTWPWTYTLLIFRPSGSFCCGVLALGILGSLQLICDSATYSQSPLLNLLNSVNQRGQGVTMPAKFVLLCALALAVTAGMAAISGADGDPHFRSHCHRLLPTSVSPGHGLPPDALCRPLCRPQSRCAPCARRGGAPPPRTGRSTRRPASSARPWCCLWRTTWTTLTPS